MKGNERNEVDCVFNFIISKSTQLLNFTHRREYAHKILSKLICLNVMSNFYKRWWRSVDELFSEALLPTSVEFSKHETISHVLVCFCVNRTQFWMSLTSVSLSDHVNDDYQRSAHVVEDYQRETNNLFMWYTVQNHGFSRTSTTTCNRMTRSVSSGYMSVGVFIKSN